MGKHHQSAESLRTRITQLEQENADLQTHLNELPHLKTQLETLRQAEQSLREREAHFRRLADSVPVMIWMTDPSGGCTYVNQPWCQFTGTTSEQNLGKSWLDCLHPEDRARARAACEQAKEQQAPCDVEYRLRRHDGAYRWVFASGAPRFDASGTLLGFIGSVLDVTERKRAEEERARLEAAVQQAQKLESLGVMAAGIAHDFNNLLTAILGYAGLALMQLPADSALCPMLREVEKAARRAGELTQQMLAYAGKGKFVVQQVHLNTLLQEMAQLLQAVVSRKATFRFSCAPGLPPIEADPLQLRQVIMNLVTNASEALGERSGVINLRTGVLRLDQPALYSPYAATDLQAGSYVYLEVRDTGCGMSTETLARIFDPFFSTKFTGRGLGLAAVMGIVRGHRGLIRVESIPEKGSTFQVLFPVAVTPAPSQSPASGQTSPHRQGSILVIEDEPGISSLAQRTLEQAGFRVLVARDGLEGLEVFARHEGEIGLVLLDLTMPRQSGQETLAEIRRRRPEVPVVLMSGYSAREVQDRFRDGPQTLFLQKPFAVDELLEALRQALGPDTNKLPKS